MRPSRCSSQLLCVVQGSAFEGLVSLHEDAQQGRKCMNQHSKARLVSMLPAVRPARLAHFLVAWQVRLRAVCVEGVRIRMVAVRF